jgi:hypothetical protein
MVLLCGLSVDFFKCPQLGRDLLIKISTPPLCLCLVGPIYFDLFCYFEFVRWS